MHTTFESEFAIVAAPGIFIAAAPGIFIAADPRMEDPATTKKATIAAPIVIRLAIRITFRPLRLFCLPFTGT